MSGSCHCLTSFNIAANAHVTDELALLKMVLLSCQAALISLLKELFIYMRIHAFLGFGLAHNLIEKSKTS
jgi:hypothetical protein